MLLAVVPMIVCGQCHAEIVARYSKTPMAMSSGLIDPADEPAGGFRHKASGTNFEIVKSGNRLEVEWDGHRQALDFYIGSRRMGRSYGFGEDGYLYQAPVGYYANRRLWDSPPGYENDRKPDFNRPITGECLFCHSSARTIPGTLNRIENLSALHGISCERCHSGVSAHLAHPQAGNVVNPRKLSFAERDSVCEQCHLSGEARIPQPGRRVTDFRPGQRLSTYLAVFVAEGRPPGIRVAGHADALASSRCRVASGGKLWCGSCHDPHGEIAIRKVCVGCHAPEACPALARASLRIAADCVACHMPKARAYDGGHTVFTDHSIPRRAPNYSSAKTEPRSLKSYFSDVDSAAADRNLGMAWTQVAENYGDPRLFERAWPLLRAAAGRGASDPALYAKVGEALESASQSGEAEKAYRLSLDQDPQQVEVLLRLAALLDRSGKRPEAEALRRRSRVILPRQ